MKKLDFIQKIKDESSVVECKITVFDELICKTNTTIRYFDKNRKELKLKEK